MKYDLNIAQHYFYIFFQDELLQKLKPPPEEAINALEQLLQTVIREKMMSPDDARERKEVVKRLHKVIKEKLPGR